MRLPSRSPGDAAGGIPWWADPLLAVAVTAVYAVELVSWHATDPVAVSGAVLVGAAGLALRRLTPLVAFILCGISLTLVGRLEPGFDNDSAALVLTFFVSLYSVGRHTRGVEALLAAGVVVVQGAVFMLGDVEGHVDSGDVAFTLFFVGAPWLAGVALRLRQDRDRTWRARTDQLRADQEEREKRAVAAERSRIARELHDVVSHAIAVTVLQARGARRMLGTDEQSVRRALDAIDHTNTQALSDMRRLLALLRDTEDGALDAPQPTLDQIPVLVDEVRGSGLPVALRVEGTPEEVPPGVELSAYRIVQEALTNVLKHAGEGATAVVDLRYGADSLELRVTDDGRGRQAPGPASGPAPGPTSGPTSGHGLVGIRERVAVVGGHVETRARAEGGFALEVRLPYAMEA